MKTEYKRDLKNNYLVIELEGEANAEDYVFHMIRQNEIEGLLPVQVRSLDGVSYLYYEVTAKQQMDILYEKKQLGCGDIRQILSEIRDILESVRKYLLSPDQILFDPQYLYVDVENGKLSVCYFPVKEKELSVLPLAEYLLKKLDHEDPEAVRLGYRFYEKASGENFSLSESLREILFEARTAGANAGSEEAKGNPAQAEWMARDQKPEYADRDPEAAGYGEAMGYEDLYEVCHRERHGQNPGKGKSGKKKNRKEGPVHPAILAAVLFLVSALVVLFYFGWLGLTEAGGIFFLVLAVAVLVNRSWKERRDRKRKKYRRDWEEDELDERMEEDLRKLESEMYRYDRDYGEDERYPGSRDGWSGEKEDGSGSEDLTQCLERPGSDEQMYLVGERQGRDPVIRIGRKVVIVGKKKGQADVLLEEAAVSRVHARLERIGGRFYVRDLNSSNGTYLNGERLNPQEQAEIRIGDTVMFANVRYKAAGGDEEMERTQLLN